RDRQLAAQLSGPQELDRHALTGEAGLVEVVRLDGGPVFEAVQLAQVDGGIDLLEPVLEAAQLGQALGQGHLAALEAEPEGLAAGALALLTPARGLASARAGAAPDPPRLLPRSLGCAQLVQLHSDLPPP